MTNKKKKLSKEIKALRDELNTKASKNAVLDGQQAFFEDLNKVEANVDHKRDTFIMEEFKRLGDQIARETANLHSRVEVSEKQDREAILQRMLDEKLDKTEFLSFVSMLTEDNINPMQK